MRPAAPAICLLACLALRPARAQTLGEYLAAGLRVVHATAVAGPFAGCVKDVAQTFADGTRFVCGETRPAFADRPRVLLLAGGVGTHVLLIGGRAYAGAVTRIASLPVETAITTSAEVPGRRGAPTPGTARPIGPIQPVESINALLTEDRARLSAARRTPRRR